MALVRDKSTNNAVDESFDDDVFTIIPSDTVKQRAPISQLYVGGAGAVSVLNNKGVAVVFSAVPVGTTLYLPGISYVRATGTTATLLVGMANRHFR